MTQAESEKLFDRWLRKSEFVHNGMTYKVGINDVSALKVMIPDDKKMTGQICFLPSELTLTNRDLDSNFHKGFTVGKGKTFYWLMIWHSSGNVTVYPRDDGKRGRWISGDTIVTVHFNDLS